MSWQNHLLPAADCSFHSAAGHACDNPACDNHARKKHPIRSAASWPGTPGSGTTTKCARPSLGWSFLWTGRDRLDACRAMKRILVTGATGQVGSALIAVLRAFDDIVVRAGVRDFTTATKKWLGDSNVQPVAFDFSDRATQDAALPRITGTPPVTRSVAELTGRAPLEFAQFVTAHRDELLNPSARP